MLYLIVDEIGTIIAVLATDATHAQQVAQAMSGHAELTLNVNWHLGEHLPIWHD